MSLKSMLKRLKKALPVIIANAPAVVEAVNEVGKAVKKEKRSEPEAAEPAPAER